MNHPLRLRFHLPSIKAQGSHCFHMYYSVYGIDSGRLEVYLIPEITSKGQVSSLNAIPIGHYYSDKGKEWQKSDIQLGDVERDFFVGENKILFMRKLFVVHYIQ